MLTAGPDIPTDCEFILDYEIDEEEWGDKKKPYRYRWPDEVRDEVLARLLELNAERAKEEARSGAVGRRRAAESLPQTRSQDTLIGRGCSREDSKGRSIARDRGQGSHIVRRGRP